MMIQKCPVCNGTGLVSIPPGIAGDLPQFTSSSCSPYPCRACNGRGWLETGGELATPELFAALNNAAGAIETILPLAKGYAPLNQTYRAKQTCNRWINAAELALEQARAAIAKANDQPPAACRKCGQVANGQGGEYPCPVCGLPTLHDDQPPTSGKGE